MNPLLVKYENGNQEGYDLGLLSESFGGINTLLRELVELTGINAEIEIRATKIEPGSIDLYNAIYLTLTGLPFNTPQELYDFLQVVSPEMYQEAKEFLSGALGVHNDLNSYFAGHAFDAVVLSELGKTYIVKAWKWAGKQKDRITTRDRELGEISPSKAQKLQGMVNGGKFKRVLKPVVQGDVRSIKVMATSRSGTSASLEITENTIEKYLPAEAQILPEFENGTVHDFTGILQNLMSARGEILKIKVEGISRSYSLITAKPPDGMTTEDFLPFYHKRVSFRAEVVRASMYKRPEFVIREMSVSQQKLVGEESEANE